MYNINMGIILASNSPRRKELLSKIIKDFKVQPSMFDERQLDEKDPLKFVISAAIGKAKDVSVKFTSDTIISADTIISFKNKIYGKPKNTIDAEKTLSLLSGNDHKVITAVTLYKKEKEKLLVGTEISTVSFNELSVDDIKNYIRNSIVLDKAGSYAIQEIGDKFIKAVKGDYDNVVGLPVKLVKILLDDFRT